AAGLLLLFSLLCGRAADAQAVYGSIIGTVTDPSGAVVPNATITVTDVAKGTSVQVQTNGDGQYRVPHLISDVYDITAEAAGFATAAQKGIQVYVDTAPRVDLQLAAQGAVQTVTVTAGAPLLETDRSDVSTVLNTRAVEQLPNLNRNFTAFELLTPGTTYIGWNVGESQNP